MTNNIFKQRGYDFIWKVVSHSVIHNVLRIANQRCCMRTVRRRCARRRCRLLCEWRKPCAPHCRWMLSQFSTLPFHRAEDHRPQGVLVNSLPGEYHPAHKGKCHGYGCSFQSLPIFLESQIPELVVGTAFLANNKSRYSVLLAKPSVKDASSKDQKQKDIFKMHLLVNHKLTEDIFILHRKLMLKVTMMWLRYLDQQQKVRLVMLMAI